VSVSVPALPNPRDPPLPLLVRRPVTRETEGAPDWSRPCQRRVSRSSGGESATDVRLDLSTRKRRPRVDRVRHVHRPGGPIGPRPGGRLGCGGGRCLAGEIRQPARDVAPLSRRVTPVTRRERTSRPSRSAAGVGLQGGGRKRPYCSESAPGWEADPRSNPDLERVSSIGKTSS
jgi:hypothetical protein